MAQSPHCRSAVRIDVVDVCVAFVHEELDHAKVDCVRNALVCIDGSAVLHQQLDKHDRPVYSGSTSECGGRLDQVSILVLSQHNVHHFRVTVVIKCFKISQEINLFQRDSPIEQIFEHAHIPSIPSEFNQQGSARVVARETGPPRNY